MREKPHKSDQEEESEMATRCEELGRELYVRPAGDVVAFPTARVKARAASRQRAEIRRRRLTIAVLPVLVVGFILASGPEGTSVASRSSAPASVMLQPGETIWDLAERYAPAAVDPRAYVDAVLEMNDISGAPAMGERVRLPK
jgi:hypothetical protein